MQPCCRWRAASPLDSFATYSRDPASSPSAAGRLLLSGPLAGNRLSLRPAASSSARLTSLGSGRAARAESTSSSTSYSPRPRSAAKWSDSQTDSQNGWGQTFAGCRVDAARRGKARRDERIAGRSGESFADRPRQTTACAVKRAEMHSFSIACLLDATAPTVALDPATFCLEAADELATSTASAGAELNVDSLFASFLALSPAPPPPPPQPHPHALTSWDTAHAAVHASRAPNRNRPLPPAPMGHFA
ncbi:unnamed protein product, partial [Protopolystoma xenopodis]